MLHISWYHYVGFLVGCRARRYREYNPRFFIMTTLLGIAVPFVVGRIWAAVFQTGTGAPSSGGIDPVDQRRDHFAFFLGKLFAPAVTKRPLSSAVGSILPFRRCTKSEPRFIRTSHVAVQTEGHCPHTNAAHKPNTIKGRRSDQHVLSDINRGNPYHSKGKLRCHRYEYPAGTNTQADSTGETPRCGVWATGTQQIASTFRAKVDAHPFAEGKAAGRMILKIPDDRWHFRGDLFHCLHIILSWRGCILPTQPGENVDPGLSPRLLCNALTPPLISLEFADPPSSPRGSMRCE